MEQFYKNEHYTLGYRYPDCKKCYVEARRAKQAVWQSTSPKAGVRIRRRRARKLALPSEPYDPFEIYERDGGTCSLCGEPCEKYKPNGHRAFHIEHVVPLQVDMTLLPLFGITEHPGDVRCNVTIAHPGCNSSKSNKMTQADADNYFKLRAMYEE